MSDDQLKGGAGPALAAHSKDGSTPGTVPQSSATGNMGGATAAGVSETVNRLSGQAREAMGQARDAVGQAASSASDLAGTAGQQIKQGGSRAAEEAMDFVRDQPLIAVIATGAVCFALGLLAARR